MSAPSRFCLRPEGVVIRLRVWLNLRLHCDVDDSLGHDVVISARPQ